MRLTSAFRRLAAALLLAGLFAEQIAAQQRSFNLRGINDSTQWTAASDTPAATDVSAGSRAPVSREELPQTVEASSNRSPDVGVAPGAAPSASPPKADASPKSTSPAKSEPVKYPTVKITGFAQLDAAWFDQDAVSREAVGDIQDLIEFRRTRLAAKGQLAENFGYMVEFDFAFPGRPSFMDVWLEAQQLPIGSMRIGQFRQAFGMDGATSARELTFLERSLPFLFVPLRQTGLMAYGTAAEEAVTWAVSGYRFPADPFGGTFGDKGYGVSGRLTSALVYVPDENFVLHLGGSYAYNQPATGLIQYRTPPEIGFNFGLGGSVPFLVDTGPLAVDSNSLYGVEAAWAFKGLLLQSEAITAQLDPTATGGSSWISGVYAQLSYVLTGEVRPYLAKQGVFGRVTPAHDFGAQGGGAWEATARYSYLDFNDGGIQGGRLTDVTAGLNWYLNHCAKLQFNYIHAFQDHPTLGAADTDVFALRAQLDF